MKSKITGGETTLIFEIEVLNKYSVKYYRCNDTGFIQTEDAYWLDEAYSSAITKLDLGLAYRNEILRDKASEIINRNFNGDASFLDYAGGYGLFTRLMRDKGFDFYHTDMYCENIFAQYFDLNDKVNDTSFELVTAFEVFEHMQNPLEEIGAMSKFGDSILFTTEVQPKDTDKIKDWWYLIPETGQHIALYTKESLQYIANKFGYNFYTDESGVHLFTKKKLSGDPFRNPRDPFLIRKMRKLVAAFDRERYHERESLLIKDWNFVKSKLS